MRHMMLKSTTRRPSDSEQAVSMAAHTGTTEGHEIGYGLSQSLLSHINKALGMQCASARPLGCT
jgi:hypothetical protein